MHRVGVAGKCAVLHEDHPAIALGTEERHQEQVEVDNTATAESLMESEELLAVKVRKLDSVTKVLESDVASIQQGFKKLLRHHDLEWEEENPALGLYEDEEPEDEGEHHTTD